MANWGLLQGFGKGLSNGSALLGQAMAEDREAERQRLREESMNARWKRQEEREDARNKVADERYADQLKRQEKLDDLTKAESEAQRKYREDTLALQREELGVKISERRRAEIEGTLGGIQRDYEKSASAVERRHERLIDAAKQLDQQNGFAKDKNGHTETDRAYIARDEALASLSKEFTAKMVPIVRSYGSELKGTAYSSFLDDVKAEEARAGDNAGKQFLRDAGVIDADGKFTDQPANNANGNRRLDAIKGIVNGDGNQVAASGTKQPQITTAQVAPQPSYVSGFDNGFSGFVNPSPAVDGSDASLLDNALYGLGSFHGSIVGIPGDAMQLAAQGAKGLLQPAYLALTTKPSEMPAVKAAYAQQKIGIGMPPPLPGETQQQYAVRTGLKK